MTATDAAPERTSGALRFGEIDPSVLPFPKHSMLRRAASEPVMGVLLQRILLMDIAHPKVGTGVDQHSGFTTQPIRRGWSTADAAIRLVFGDRETALAAAEHVYRVHDHINGPLEEPMTSAEPAAHYTAHDAELILWVWATLVDTIELTYDRWVHRLEPADAEALYRDLVVWGQFFGIPADLLPPDRAAFRDYLDAMLDNPELGSSAVSHEVAANVLYPPALTVPAPLVRPLRVLSVSLLDPRLRARFGIELSERDRRYAERLDRRLVRYYHWLPMLRTYGPILYLALRRPVARALRLDRNGRR